MILMNYVKTSLRNTCKQKLFSFISISSLAVGLAVFIFFFLFVRAAFIIDTHHPYADRLYTVFGVYPQVNKADLHTAYVPAPLTEALQSEIPEIEATTRVVPLKQCVLKSGERSFYEDGGIGADANFFTFFTFPFSAGNVSSMLAQPTSIVLSKSLARKYFGDEPAIGKILTLDRQIDLQVTGVLEEGISSSLKFQFVVPLNVVSSLQYMKSDWSIQEVNSYVRLAEGANPSAFDDRLLNFTRQHFPRGATMPLKLYFFPMKELHFRPNELVAFSDSDSKSGYYISFAMGVLLLLVVCMNYTNLSTARYADRVKEVGIRKSIGASRGNLAMQFLGESIFHALLALPLALVLYQLYYPSVSNIIHNRYDLSVWSHPIIILYLLAITVVVGILSGGYPAYLLSRFNPLEMLKGKAAKKSKGRLRKFLVVFQFSMSIIFIVFALSVKKGSDYAFVADLGYANNNILVLPIPEEAQATMQPLKQELTTLSSVASITASSGLPGRWRGRLSKNVLPEGGDRTSALSILTFGVDHNFLKTMNMKLHAGRDFSPDFGDEANYLIDRRAAEHFGWSDPVGKVLTVDGKQGVVIGVVENFHFASIQSLPGPKILYLEKNNLNYLLAKVWSTDQLASIQVQMRKTWKNLNPDVPFTTYTLEEDLLVRERSRQQVSIFLSAIGAVAIFFSALGLFGLVSYSIRQRTKEIGVRKVLGASTGGIVLLLGKNYLNLILLSNIVGLPLALYISRLFLTETFPLCPQLGAGFFLLVSSLTVLSAFLALVSQVMKGAAQNPVDSLRYE